MTTAVTNDFRTLLANLLKDDIASGTNKYYVGLARSDEYSTDLDISSRKEQRGVRSTLHAVKILSNASFVVPINTWSANETYNPFDDSLPDQTDFYVNNSLNEVFVCVEQPKDFQGLSQPSTVEPTSTLASSSADTFATSDGYKWRYLFKMSNLAVSNFKTSTFIPVKLVPEAPTILEEVQQYAFQQNAIAGEIIGLAIDSAGTNYTSVPTITISGNGSGASFTPSIYGGQIVAINIDSDGSGNYSHGSGYDFAKATLSYGDASLRPIIAPPNGLNANPINTLKSKNLMVQVDFDADENDTIIIADNTIEANDFRQVALFRKLKKYGSDSDFTANTGSALKYLEVSSVSDRFNNDVVFNNSTENASAKVFWHDQSVSPERIYYYQDDETGYEGFTNSDTITDINNETAVIDAQGTPDFDVYSGDILYINTLETAVDRRSNQTEDIRIVFQLG